MRILFVTQTIDADHPALAQTVDLVRALAARATAVTVLCDSVRRHELPANVEFRTFGARTRAGRTYRFLRAARAVLLSRRRPDAVLVHMVPLFLLLLAPLAKPARVRLLLWYTHWHASRSLRLATKLADAVLSVDRRSFPLATTKLQATGHAIDVSRFTPGEAQPPAGPLQLLALGRMARWKGYETMLEGLRLAVDRGLDADLELRGPALTADEQAHAAELAAIVAESQQLRARVRIEQPLAREEIPGRLRRADALLSATQPRGSETLDKVVYEAAACGVPVVASNAALEEFLGGLDLELRFSPRDAGALAEILLGLARAAPEARREAGLELRRRVVADHSLDSWADVVAATLAAGARGGPAASE
jgi:glycosyltransferase involved in cell wall biosynthesis